MATLTSIVMFTTVTMIANTVVLFINTKTIMKVLDEDV
jgi:hypothetical protein